MPTMEDLNKIKSIKLYNNPFLKEEYQEVKIILDKNAENIATLQEKQHYYNLAEELNILEQEKIKDHSSATGEFGYVDINSSEYNHVKIGEGIEVENGVISASFSGLPEVQIVNPLNNQVLQYDHSIQKIKNINGYEANFTLINKNNISFPKRKKLKFINTSFQNDTLNDTLIISRKVPLTAQQVEFDSEEFPNSNAQDVIDNTLTLLTTKAYPQHASSSIEHGVGTDTEYGHVKISDNINTNSTSIAASVNALLSIKEDAIPKYNYINNMNIYRGENLQFYFNDLEDIAKALYQEDLKKLQNIYLGDYIEIYMSGGSYSYITVNSQYVKWIVMDMERDLLTGNLSLILVPEQGLVNLADMGGDISEGYINSDMFAHYLDNYEEIINSSLDNYLYPWDELLYGDSTDPTTGHTNSITDTTRTVALLTEYEVFGGSVATANELDYQGGTLQQLRGFLYNPKLKRKYSTEQGAYYGWWLNSPGKDYGQDIIGYSIVNEKGIPEIKEPNSYYMIVPKIKFGKYM